MPVDTSSGTVVQTLKTGRQPEAVRTTPDGKRVWVTSEETGNVSVIDLAAVKVAKTFKVGHRPRSIAFMPDGARAYVNAENDGSVVLGRRKEISNSFDDSSWQDIYDRHRDE